MLISLDLIKFYKDVKTFHLLSPSFLHPRICICYSFFLNQKTNTNTNKEGQFHQHKQIVTSVLGRKKERKKGCKNFTP
jgi:hypothetical protein